MKLGSRERQWQRKKNLKSWTRSATPRDDAETLQKGEERDTLPPLVAG